MQLQPGQIVRVRSRQYLVEEVIPPPEVKHDTLVRLSCLADDALGEQLQVLWEREVDAKIIGATPWDVIAKRGFDEPAAFSAYLHTLRWNCVTSTNPNLFQAPYRAGIEVKAYQLEPLRRALNMPRVNLFIADDVGLGKTIEAGLILREMLMRQRVRRVVVACPPSVVWQWRDEMEQHGQSRSALSTSRRTDDGASQITVEIGPLGCLSNSRRQPDLRSLLPVGRRPNVQPPPSLISQLSTPSYKTSPTRADSSSTNSKCPRLTLRGASTQGRDSSSSRDSQGQGKRRSPGATRLPCAIS